MTKIEKFPSKARRRLKVDAVNRRKFRIGLDEGHWDLAASLKGLGYSTWVPPRGTPDIEIDKQLRELNLKYLLTKDFRKYANVNGRTYFVIGLPRRYEDIGLTRVIEKFFLKFQSCLVPGGCINICQAFIAKNGLCKEPRFRQPEQSSK